MAAKGKTDSSGRKVVTANKKAHLKYEILETYDAGLALLGTEVKSLRAGHARLDEAFGRIYDEELFVVGAHIDEYSHGNLQNHQPTRRRKLLLRRHELAKILARVKQKGFTLVPLTIYFNERGLAKMTIALCTGKNVHDKRDTIRKKEAQREMRSRS